MADIPKTRIGHQTINHCKRLSRNQDVADRHNRLFKLICMRVKMMMSFYGGFEVLSRFKSAVMLLANPFCHQWCIHMVPRIEPALTGTSTGSNFVKLDIVSRNGACKSFNPKELALCTSQRACFLFGVNSANSYKYFFKKSLCKAFRAVPSGSKSATDVI